MLTGDHAMFHRSNYLIVLMLALLMPLSACGGQQPQDTSALPTIMDFPTDAPTNTPGITPTTAVPTVTFTFTPSLTLTFTRTPTPITPTFTFTPSNTSPPRPTATFTLTKTFTPQPATITPQISPTSDTPQIISFTASTNVAVAGGTVELTWESIGDIARIDRLNQLGQVVQTFSVTPVGQLPVTIPANEGSVITYRLAVGRGNQEVTSTLTITVSGGATNCPINWFFGNELAPPNAGCPVSAATQTPAAYQPFQTGRMIYLQTSNLIYVLIDPGGVTSGSMTQQTNGWDGTSTYESYGCGDQPPTGLHTPKKMFAWVYCTTLGPNGLWSTTLGFGLTGIDETVRTIQTDTAGGIYIDTPEGSVYRIEPVPAGQLTSTWLKIK
jgi:hypothetical protein